MVFKCLPSGETENGAHRDNIVGPHEVDIGEGRLERIGHVEHVVWNHEAENKRDANERHDHESECNHNGYWKGALGVLHLLASRANDVEADEGVERLRRARQHALKAVGHEAAGAAISCLRIHTRGATCKVGARHRVGPRDIALSFRLCIFFPSLTKQFYEKYLRSISKALHWVSSSSW